MDKMEAIAGILLVIALAGLGLPAGAGVQAQGDCGLVASDLWGKRP